MADYFEDRLDDRGNLILYEWEKFDVKQENFENLCSRISPSKEEHLREIDVYNFYGPKIKAKHFVGAMGFEDPIPLKDGEDSKKLNQIIIKPKVGMANFIKMIEVAYQVKLPELKPEAELGKEDDLRVILALIYIKTAEELLRRHLRRNYVIIVDHLNSKVKGKLLLKPYIRDNLARGMPHISVCQFYELTPDTLLNRVVKAGLRISQRLLHQSYSHTHFRDTLSGEASRFIGLLGGVSDVRITVADFARIRLHSQNRHYEPALKIARLLILCQHPAQEVGGCKVRGFFLDMNDLFERFVAGLFSMGGFNLKYPGIRGGYHHYVGDEKKKKELKPDITIDDSWGRIIMDVKYKEIFEERKVPDDELIGDIKFDDISLKIIGSDIYQLVAYLDNANSERGILLYPLDETGILIPDPDRFVTNFGSKRIYLVGIGLKSINWYEKNLDEWVRKLTNILNHN